MMTNNQSNYITTVSKDYIAHLTFHLTIYSQKSFQEVNTYR